jgi:hypothetical protein
VLLADASAVIDPETLLNQISVDFIKFIKHFLDDESTPQKHKSKLR